MVHQTASSPEAFGFHTSIGGGQHSTGVRFHKEGGVAPPTTWRSRGRGDSEDQVQVDCGGGEGGGADGVSCGEMEAFASALREEFERTVRRACLRGGGGAVVVPITYT